MFESDHCSDCVVTYLCDPVRRNSGLPSSISVVSVIDVDRTDIDRTDIDRTDIDSTDTSSGVSMTAIVFDLEELRAVKLLADAGLVPKLRHTSAG